MADAKNATPSENVMPGEDDGALLAVEASEPVILQEPDPMIDPAKPALADPNTPPQAPAKPKSGLMAFVISGALVAAAGFGVARYLFPETGAVQAVAALQTQLEAAARTDAALRSDLEALATRPVAPPPDPALEGRITALEAALADRPDTAALSAQVSAQVAALDAKLTAIEAASATGAGPPAAAFAAMDREIKALRSEIDAQKGAGTALTAEIGAATAATEARLEAAEAAAVTAAKQAALSHVRAAFDSGAPLGPALDGVSALGADVPETLAAAAQGLPTLVALQDGFAEPARAALDASIRADMGDGWTDRLSAFLRSQTGARSLTPREGDDPDAVLSRAEAALRSGDVKTSLAELALLPPAGAEAMAGWVTDAQRRIDAEMAISALSATLSGE